MELSEIKSRLQIIQVVKHYGLKPNRHDMLVCPFHDDHNPSLKLYTSTNTFHCFGCGKSGDQVEFIQLKEKCSKHEAILKAKTLVNPTYTLMKEPKELSRIAVFTKYLQATKTSIERSKPAQEYCQSRNLNYPKLNIGFNGIRLLDNWNDKLKESALEIGLLTKISKGYSQRFKNCITFELQNQQGQPAGIYGRNIDESSTKKHVYLPGTHQGLYPCYPKPETERLILNESIIDAATLQQITSITKRFSILALFGTNGFTEEHRKAIKGLKNLKEIILFFDGDDPGGQAITKYTSELKTLHPEITISHIETPKDEDINSLAVGHNEEVFLHLLDQRKQSVTEHTPNPPEITKNIDASNPTFSKLSVENPEYIYYENGDIIITIWGKIDINHINRLRATLHIQLKSNVYAEYRDTIDLYSHNQTSRLIREASSRLETDTDTISLTISELTRNLEQYRQEQRELRREREKQEAEKSRERFTETELNKGLQLLESNNLMQQTFEYIKNIGLIGEEKNGFLLFIILLTRMFNNPLHALVQGKSGSGKTYLLKKIADLIPKQHIRITTALTENTLYHSLEDFWKHSILLIEDLDGAYGALLPLREMMTNQSICKYTTEKDLKTGEFKQKALYVEGPVCVAGATTKDKIYEDNANRSFQIHVKEDHEHIEKVLEYQRRYISGLTERKAEEQIQSIFKTAQLHLRPIEIIIPFGNELRIPDYVYKKLRTNTHYMTLIKAIAFWNQKRREIKKLPDGTQYIEATLEDVEWANFLSKEVLLRKSDELTGALRSFFEAVKRYLKESTSAKASADEKQKCFYVKPIREILRMNPMQVSRYLRELDARGYIQRTGGNRKKGYEYEILVWDDYEKLKSGINILDEILVKLKQTLSVHTEPSRSVTQV